MAQWTEYQKKAIEHFGHNILVSAGAGSGKTAVLSERVYRLVGERKIDIDHLLVLTFTNKAAAEMKSRIRTKIVKDEDHLFASEEEKMKQINKIDSSFIMTFDAYALFLVKKYHDLLNIDQDIAIIDANILANEEEELLDQIMEEEYERRSLDFVKLIDAFCVKDDSNIRDLIRQLNYKLSSIYERKDYIKDYSDRFYSKDAINGYIERYTALAKDRISLIRKLTEEFAWGAENTEEYFMGLDDLFHVSSYDQIKDAATNIEITKKRLPKGSGVSEVKKQISEEIKKLKKLCLSDEGTLRKETEMTLDYDLCLLRLADQLDEEVSAFKAEKKLYDFADIFRMSIDLIVLHPEIAKEISDGFDEILIDEYQDTNDLQDEFISRIAKDNVYMVGDMKQSIYRFRNANPKLFMKKYLDYEDDEKDELIILPHNFRSRSEIIDDVNVVFDRLMDLEIGGCQYRRSHHMEAGRTDGRYEGQDNHLEIINYLPEETDVDLSSFNKHEIEAFIMAKDISDKVGTFLVKDDKVIRPARYSDFCIIVDRTNNFDLYKQILTYHNIPCVIEKDEKMSDSDLISALKAVFALLEKIEEDDLGYDFRFAFLSLARSFLVNMKDEEIYEIFKEESFRETDIYQTLKPLADDAYALSLTSILDEIISVFDVYERVYTIGDVKENLIKIDYLYQLCKSLNGAGYDYRMFNRYLENIFDSGEERDITYRIDQDSEDAVRIINIHKSKGLQYKICYFPALDVDFNLSDIRDRFLFSKDAGIITPVNIEGRGLKQSLRKSLYVDDFLKEDIGEKMRLLYVALTRSEEKIIMIASLKDETGDGDVIDPDLRIGYRNFADMLNSIYQDLDGNGFIRDCDLSAYPFSKDYRYPKKQDLYTRIQGSNGKIEERKITKIIPEKIERSRFSKDSGLIDPSTIEKMELGTKLHYYLETLNFIDPDYSLVDERFVHLIRNFMESDLMKDVKKGKPYKEYEFIYEENGERKHGFIDLLMEYEDHFDIIDYKTKNIDDEHYDEQLNGYRTYISSVSDKKVNCYLYSIIDGGYREVKR